MNLTQQRFLLNRLDEAKRSKPSRYGSKKIALPPTPLKVKQAKAQIEKAKKVVEDWNEHCDELRSQITDAVESAFHEAKQAVLFAETADAIKAVEKFERAKF
jgi:hypothetical protein